MVVDMHVPEDSAVLLVLLYYAAYIIVPVLAVLVFASIGDLLEWPVTGERPGGFLIAAAAAVVTIPVFWMVGLRLDLFDRPTIGLWLIIGITLALLGLGVLASGPESRGGSWRATHKGERNPR